MRDCYKKFWKMVLVEEMRAVLPQFTLRESASRKAADGTNPSSKPVRFVWNAVDKLAFTLEFAAPGRQDNFEAYCRWSETGKSKVEGLFWLDHPFAKETFEAPDAVAMVQALSDDLGDNPRVFKWDIWEPETFLEASPESHAAWQAEFIAEELRGISDDEARRRVEAAVNRAMADIKRCALPWFEKKLEWYKNRN